MHTKQWACLWMSRVFSKTTEHSATQPWPCAKQRRHGGNLWGVSDRCSVVAWERHRQVKAVMSDPITNFWAIASWVEQTCIWIYNRCNRDVIWYHECLSRLQTKLSTTYGHAACDVIFTYLDSNWWTCDVIFTYLDSNWWTRYPKLHMTYFLCT